MARILVIGGTGMLGSMLLRVLRHAGHEVQAARRGEHGFEAARGTDGLPVDIDFAINAAAVTRPGKPGGDSLAELLATNAVFPWRLAELAAARGFRLIHISTDAVFASSADAKFEDDPTDAADPYGMSKRLGEPESPWALSLRCSIVGPEPSPRGHLLEWLLAHKDGATVTGHTDKVWNGVTTLQLAEFCERLVSSGLWARLRERTPAAHFSPNLPLSKAELLVAIARAFGRDIRVEAKASGAPVTRILDSRHRDLLGIAERRPFAEALSALRHCVSGAA